MVQSLIHSKTSTDVIEAVKFFVRAVNFNVKGTKKSLQGCFSLVFHQVHLLLPLGRIPYPSISPTLFFPIRFPPLSFTPTPTPPLTPHTHSVRPFHFLLGESRAGGVSDGLQTCLYILPSFPSHPPLIYFLFPLFTVISCNRRKRCRRSV